jgi:hypothetical protein
MTLAARRSGSLVCGSAAGLADKSALFMQLADIVPLPSAITGFPTVAYLNTKQSALDQSVIVEAIASFATSAFNFDVC